MSALRAGRFGSRRFRGLEVDMLQQRRRDRRAPEDLPQLRGVPDPAVRGAMTDDAVTLGLMKARNLQQLLRIGEVDPCLLHADLRDWPDGAPACLKRIPSRTSARPP
jgi:hypothetical protein